MSRENHGNSTVSGSDSPFLTIESWVGCHERGQGEDDEPDDHAAEHYEEPATASGYVAEPVEAAPVEAEESEEEDMANVRWTK